MAAADGAGKDARDLVVDFAERANRVGDFEYKVGNFRMRRSSLTLTLLPTSADECNSVDEIRDFMHNGRSVIQLTDDYAEEQRRSGTCCVQAYMDLYNQFIGEEVLAASSRAMQTAGAELATQLKVCVALTMQTTPWWHVTDAEKSCISIWRGASGLPYQVQVANEELWPEDGVTNAEQFATILEEFKEGRRRISQEAKTFSETLLSLHVKTQ